MPPLRPRSFPTPERPSAAGTVDPKDARQFLAKIINFSIILPRLELATGPTNREEGDYARRTPSSRIGPYEKENITAKPYNKRRRAA